jgi:hypothetical protein
MQQRATAIESRKIKGALSFGLALPLSFVAPLHAESLGSLSAAAGGLQQWREYALQSITPEFSWSAPAARIEAPTLLDRAFGGTRNTVATLRNGRSSLSLDVMSDFVGSSERTRLNDFHGEGQPGLQRTLISPAYSQRVGEHGQWTLAAVLAYQRFASGDLGALQQNYFEPSSLQPGEVSYGRGVRMDFSDALTDNLRWNFGYQSRVNMDAFSNFRGVFADPGDFDIPASASAALRIGTASPLSFSIGVERVMYSEIRPFTSASLPRRFLAVLGDGSNPVFAWRDLTVYSVGGSWRDDTFGELALRYSTREQPSPTSHLLQRLLTDEQSNYGVELSYAKNAGASRVEFSASYSPFQYVLGAPTSYSVRHDNGRNQVEFEARWSVAF